MVSPASQNQLVPRLRGFGTSIFSEMTQLAMHHQAVNLGQGFPNFDGPEFVKEAAIQAIREGHNQYARMSGVPALNQAIANHQERFYGLSYDPDAEITVTSGATEAICATLLALCQTGDEVLMFEPFYDSYRASIAMADAVPKVITLRAPDFALDLTALAAAITPKTRLLLLNTPHNPTGKVFARQELEQIAQLCRERDLLVVSDEVYEHLVFTGEHIPIATLEGMRERTITISSTGKTFSFTGWKIGYACAPESLSAAIRTAHQFMTFSTATPLQHAMAVALEAEDAFYEQFLAEYRQRRDLLCQGLAEVGFKVMIPEGTYFVLADIRPLGFTNDVELCRLLPPTVGVAAIPPSAFYLDSDDGQHLVRFAFCKTLDVLREGITRLSRLKKAGG